MINFSKVEYAVRDLRRQVAFAEIDQSTFESRLLELIDIAADGHYWMFGHDSEIWYQHDGNNWVQKDPGDLRLLTPNNDSTSQRTDAEVRASNSTQPVLIAEWRAMDWGWFITSLIIISLVGWVVYASV